jgi:hypothetical protein
MVWTEQGELWNAGPAAEAVKRPARVAKETVKPSRSRAPTLHRAHTLARPKVVAPAVARRTAGSTGSYAEKHNSVRTADIARYLQVNSAVDGVASTSWFKLPRRTFTAAFEHALWKGREVGTPFVTGC